MEIDPYSYDYEGVLKQWLGQLKALTTLNLIINLPVIVNRNMLNDGLIIIDWNSNPKLSPVLQMHSR